MLTASNHLRKSLSVLLTFSFLHFFIGVGGALGFIVDGIDWEKTLVSQYFGSQIKVVYIFAVVAYVVTTACNLFSIKVSSFRAYVRFV